MKILDYSRTINALHSYIKEYNEQQDQCKNCIRGGTRETSRQLIIIYGQILYKWNGLNPLNNESVALPSLATNNVQLSTCTESSSRTIQRHIKRLQEAEIIVNKVSHGSNSNYELWINPKFLRFNEHLLQESVKQRLHIAIQRAEDKIEKQGISEDKTTKCPHTDTGYSNNNLLIQVDKLTTGSSESKQVTTQVTDKGNLHTQTIYDKTGYTTGYTGEIEQENSKKNIATGEIEPTRAEVSSGNKKVSGREPARVNFLNLKIYADMLWLLARNVLYDDIYLTDYQIKTAKELIRELYKPISSGQISRIHQIYCERIDLAGKYVQKDPKNRFIQLPDQYFDVSNPNGFVGTKKWYKAHRKRKKEVQSELILDRQIRKYLNNIKKGTDTPKPLLKTFRECQNTLGKLGDPTLTRRFHAAVLDFEAYKQIN